MTLTPQQIAMRRTGITATDIGAIVGEDPYRSAIDVFCAKMGEDVTVESEAMEFGATWAERWLLEWYAHTFAVAIQQPGTVRHPRHATHLATPDGLTVANGVECKAHGWRALRGYGEPGTDHVPRRELLQCAWGMHVCIRPRWDLARLDVPPAVYTIHRDLELEAMLCEEADRFWRDHVVTHTPPPPDGTARYSDWLARRYPRGTEGTISADADLQVTVARLRAAREQHAEIGREIDTLVQEIQCRMGDAEVLDLGDRQRIAWRPRAGGTAWKAVAEALASDLGAQAKLKELAQQHRSPATRTFSVPRSWGKET